MLLMCTQRETDANRKKQTKCQEGLRTCHYNKQYELIIMFCCGSPSYIFIWVEMACQEFMDKTRSQ